MNDEAFEEAAVSWLTARGWSVTKGAASNAQGFDAFWQAYPRKINKQAARAAFERATKRGILPTAIIEGLHAHLEADAFSSEEKYIPHATTWLNGKRWLDAPEKKWAKPQIGGRRSTAKAIDDWLNDGS